MRQFIVGLGALTVLFAVQAQAAEVTWQKDIKPIFEKRCAGCHGAGAPEQGEFKKDKKKWTDKGVGMRMDSYSHLITFVGWPESGALMRRVDDGANKEDKKAGNMYQHLGATEAERQANLEVFKAWVGNWNLKRWKDVSKDELTTIKVAY